jgi:hypothetical protein
MRKSRLTSALVFFIRGGKDGMARLDGAVCNELLRHSVRTTHQQLLGYNFIIQGDVSLMARDGEVTG